MVLLQSAQHKEQKEVCIQDNEFYETWNHGR